MIQVPVQENSKSKGEVVGMGMAFVEGRSRGMKTPEGVYEQIVRTEYGTPGNKTSKESSFWFNLHPSFYR